MENICQCGCGLPAKVGKRFRKYHNLSADGRALRWIGWKYEYNARLVMVRQLGRDLLPGECVHHRNGNRNDDRAENLHLCQTQTEHIQEHHSPGWSIVACAVCGKEHRDNFRRKFPLCSKECRKQWKSPGRPIETGAGVTRQFVCAVCGKECVGKRATSKEACFCSHECYAASLRGTPAKPRTDSRMVEYRGQQMNVAELSRLSGLPYKMLHGRLCRGLSADEAVTRRVRSARSR